MQKQKAAIRAKAFTTYPSVFSPLLFLPPPSPRSKRCCFTSLCCTISLFLNMTPFHLSVRLFPAPSLHQTQLPHTSLRWLCCVVSDSSYLYVPSLFCLLRHRLSLTTSLSVCMCVCVCVCCYLAIRKKKSLKHTSALPTQNNLMADVLQRSASWSSQFHCFERKKERAVPNKRKNCYAPQNQHNYFNIVNFWSSCSLIIIDSQQCSKVAHSVEP